MRSELALILMSVSFAAACATPAQIEQCYPAPSWSAPVYNCVAAAPPPPPKPEPKPEPTPEPEPPKVEVKQETIDLKEKVNFEVNSDVLLPGSKTLLDDVAKTLADHKELKRVRIEGHTDSQAGTTYNQRLSEKRARAVKEYLVSKGIDGKRLDTKGWGETKPVADNKTEDGREQNRRVEIHIVEREK